MAKIIPLNNITKLDVPVDTILEHAKGRLEGFVLIGYDTDGKEYFASTYADGGMVLWLLKRCELALMEDEEL